ETAEEKPAKPKRKPRKRKTAKATSDQAAEPVAETPDVAPATAEPAELSEEAVAEAPKTKKRARTRTPANEVIEAAASGDTSVSAPSETG
ncbi:MAG: ATP-dependent helicase, partial [Pseudomonadota bacterium]